MLREAVGGEVVNADAMQLYRGMDIGTAKLAARRAPRRPAPPARRPRGHRDGQRRRLPAGRRAPTWTAIWRAAVGPVLVGGSGLYVRAVLDELDIPGTDPRGARAAGGRAGRGRAAALHARLAAVDPAAAAAILPSNGRRIVRALEVVELTGRAVRRVRADRGPRATTPCSVGLDSP